jgi:hypothetical protein
MVDRRVARLVPGGEGRRMMAAEGVVVLYALEEVALAVEAERRVVRVTAGDALIGLGGAEAVIERGRAVWARVARL